MSRLYVGRLPRDVRERDIERLFKGYGQIRDICLLAGFGFVEFRDRRDAEDVMHDFNNREFMGERLLIEPARVDRRRERERGPPGRRDEFDDNRPPRGPMSAPQRTPFRVLVENLSSSVSWQDLKDFARRAGEVSFADAHKLRPGEGVVEFIDETGLKNALRKLDGEDLRGRRVVIREDTGSRAGAGGRPPRDRSYSRRSRSRSRSPGGAGGRSPYYRKPSYRSPSPRRRTSRSRSASPRGRGDQPPPPPPAAHGRRSSRSPLSPRSPRSPRSPLSPQNHDMGGEPNPADPADDGAGSNWA